MKLALIAALSLASAAALAQQPFPSTLSVREPSQSREVADAGSTFRYTVLYDFRSSEFSTVAGTKFGTIPKFLGRDLEPEIWFPVVGIGAATGRTNLGGALVFTGRLGANLRGYLGLQAVAVQGEKPRGGLILGIAFER